MAQRIDTYRLYPYSPADFGKSQDPILEKMIALLSLVQRPYDIFLCEWIDDLGENIGGDSYIVFLPSTGLLLIEPVYSSHKRQENENKESYRVQKGTIGDGMRVYINDYNTKQG